MRITVKELRRLLREVDERDELASIYSDVYKEKYGIRPRGMDFSQMSLEDLKADLERLYGEEGTVDWEEESSLEALADPDPMADFMVPTNTDFHPYETLPSRQGFGKRGRFKESVVDMGSFKKKRDVKAYEGIIGKFVATSQSGVENLQFCKEFLDPEEQGVFDELLKTYRRGASDLSAFLRAKRLRMLK
jgi:hypothetical protein